MKTLSICIPTYKRPEMLRQCVLSAIDSAAGCPIEICIADDSVSDVNREVMEALTAAWPFVRWKRNQTNLGIDLNIQNAVAMSGADYAWLIGEDDRFLPGAIAQMVELVQRPLPPFVFSNFRYVNEDHSRVLGVAIPDAADGVLAAEPFIAESLWTIGFIGGCVLQREAWERTSHVPFEGTYYSHVGRIVDMLARDPELYVSARPAVSNRAGGADTFTWKKDAFGVFLGFEEMCRIAGQRHPALRDALSRSVTTFRRKFAYFSVKTTFRLRSEGALDWRQYRRYIVDAQIEPWRKAWILGLALTPCALLKPLARAYGKHRARHAS